ncbi:MAG: hypothetical protein ABIH23_17015 [bacterium]
MMRYLGIFVGLICTAAFVSVPVGQAQPLNGTPIELTGFLPMLSDAGFTPINQEVPLLVGRDPDNDDREPQTAVLANGAAVAYWVNRGGSHHWSGMNPDGTRIFPVFGAGEADVIVGVNTGSNTNWTICEPSTDHTKFLIASTWQYGSLGGSDAVVPDTVGDADGVTMDEGQGHGFFKIFDMNYNEVTSGPVSVGQISLGHRDWGAAGLTDGKWAFGVLSRDHPWDFDPDGSISSDTPFLDLFNADGTRFKDEFAPTVQAGQGQITEDLTGDQGGRFHIAPMKDSFAYIIRGSGNGPKVIIYDNNGNVLNSYSTEDPAMGLSIGEWIAGAGGDTFVALIGPTSGTEAMAALGMPADLIGLPVLLARRFDAQGPVGDYILVTTGDAGGIGRPRIAMAPNGSFALSWEDELSDEVTFTKSMAFRVFNADGTPASDACLAHDLPELVLDGNPMGGNPGEPMIGMNDSFVSLVWASRAWTNGGNRDVAMNVVANPAQGAAAVRDWELY